MIGRKFGRLIVESFAGKIDVLAWNCLCDCGGRSVVRGTCLRSGGTSSCGCVGPEKRTKHGETGSKIYMAWIGIKHRCFNNKNKSYPDYGGRGISICSDWLDYSKFKDWALMNGYSERLSIERIDNNGDYAPNNCRWTTMSEQSNNKRSTIRVTIGDCTKPISIWADEFNMKKVNARYRFRKNSERAFLFDILTKKPVRTL